MSENFDADLFIKQLNENRQISTDIKLILDKLSKSLMDMQKDKTINGIAVVIASLEFGMQMATEYLGQENARTFIIDCLKNEKFI